MGSKNQKRPTQSKVTQREIQTSLERRLAGAQGLINILDRYLAGQVMVIELDREPGGQFLQQLETGEKDQPQFNFSGTLETTPRFTRDQAEKMVNQAISPHPVRAVHIIDAARREVTRLTALVEFAMLINNQEEH